MGVLAILMPNALLGELTPKMAEAIGNSGAQKFSFRLTVATSALPLRKATPFSSLLTTALNWSNAGLRNCADQD